MPPYNTLGVCRLNRGPGSNYAAEIYWFSVFFARGMATCCSFYFAIPPRREKKPFGERYLPVRLQAPGNSPIDQPLRLSCAPDWDGGRGDIRRTLRVALSFMALLSCGS